MSRSYKKSPYISDNSKIYKKIAHKTTRRRIKNMNDVLPSKGEYNKLYESYYLHDYSPRWTKEEAVECYNIYRKMCDLHECDFEPHHRYESLKNYLKYWAKCSYRK